MPLERLSSQGELTQCFNEQLLETKTPPAFQNTKTKITQIVLFILILLRNQ